MLVVSLTLAGCQPGDQKNPAGKEHPIKGKVTAVDVSKPSVKLDHEAIPGLDMKAMEMDYPVANSKMLEGIKAGDEVQGRVKMESGKYLITQLEKR
ncbi:MAG: copper-binding protein [Planctomycetes bacterium]|nr:copper-binding protein [Planctomycetota bacterium]